MSNWGGMEEYLRGIAGLGGRDSVGEFINERFVIDPLNQTFTHDICTDYTSFTGFKCHPRTLTDALKRRGFRIGVGAHNKRVIIGVRLK